ncbi:MAG: RnfABCDGE type electron transport complex subunit D [Bacteroidales bacterium]|jgi:electron transport complex protein RnfD|nr:RnfABCDGE type electron transport complex subunit D [Bacteroidales bacterium]
MSKLFTVSPSPHVHSGNSVERLMYDVLLALMPAFFVSVWFFGLGALYVTVVSVLCCMLAEYVISKHLLKQEPALRDGSAAVTGLLLAFNVPTNLPVWILILGAVTAIGVGKMTFGGLGNNPFNPALTGRVFMLISFPVQMTSWPKPLVSRWNLETVLNFGKYPAEYVDSFTGATPLGVVKEGVKALDAASGATRTLSDMLTYDVPSTFDLLIGKSGGSMGEISAVALLLGLVYLLVRKVITWHIPVSILLTTAIFTGILWRINPEANASPVFHLLTGGLLLGAVFMATDYVTSPMSRAGMLVYGVGIGAITVIIRVFGAYPEGMSFAILIMNAFVPLINIYLKPARFGKEVKNGR